MTMNLFKSKSARFSICLFFATATQTVANEMPKPSSTSASSAKAAAKSTNEMKSQVVRHVTLTNKLIDGKKTWVPSELKIKAGEPVEIELINTLPDPHGFNLPGLAENVVVGGNEKKTVTLNPATKETIKFDCQLHPAHVGGQFIIE
jgi:hypothetical protein